jgi:molybdenum cofactor guanylyltransferase
MTERAEDIAGFVLAGGKSSRMGRDKAMLEIGGVPMVVRTARLVESVAGTATIVGHASAHEPLDLRWIKDGWPGEGPLGAIVTALLASNAKWSLVVACDLPYVTGEWLEFLIARALPSHADAVLARSERGLEPLCAMYGAHAKEKLNVVLSSGVRKVKEGLNRLDIETIEPDEWKRFDSDGLLFKNMNTPEDYEEARNRLEAIR